MSREVTLGLVAQVVEAGTEVLLVQDMFPDKLVVIVVLMRLAEVAAR